jgi:hypothetical protein
MSNMFSAQPFNLHGYAVDCLRINHSTWVVMPLTVFGITIQLGWMCSAQTFNLDVYAVEYIRHKHST